jgi:LPPG:FO 2-phospho-L-lactate transferase
VTKVALLAGGTGGGKLAAGLQEIVGADLSVIVNTADDFDVHGLRVSADPDLVTYWLTAEIDEERGWGIRDDGFVVHERLERLGAPAWFSLSDRDLATCLYRTYFIAEGGTLTAAQGQIARALGARAAVLPVCEERVTTRIRTPAGWRELQEFLILDHGEASIEGIEVAGIEDARATPDVLAALGAAEVIVIAPSNPVISIGPILAIEEIRQAMLSSPAPVVAVSPLVAGKSIKGPTEAFVAAAGRPVTPAGIASLYEGLLDGFVVDSDDPGDDPDDVAVLRCPTLMAGAGGRRALAERVLDLARTLRA